MFTFSRRIFVCTALVVSLVTVSGCGPFWVDPYITVKESQLNWVHITYYNMNRKPIRRTSVYLSGSGLVEVKRGTSELVSNDFAKKHKDAEWKNIKSFRVQIDPKDVKDIFQNLVNHGLLDREKTFKSADDDNVKRFIGVKANIDTNTYSDNVNMFLADPDLAEELLDVIREFENPGL